MRFKKLELTNQRQQSCRQVMSGTTQFNNAGHVTHKEGQKDSQPTAMEVEEGMVHLKSCRQG